jgi:uncharacterized protein YjbJ (UPF0337 family)
MSQDRIEAQWKQRRGKAMHYWGKMMYDELAKIASKHEEFMGRLQEEYGITEEEAKGQVDHVKKTVGELKKSSGNLIRLQKSFHTTERREDASIQETL